MGICVESLPSKPCGFVANEHSQYSTCRSTTSRSVSEMGPPPMTLGHSLSDDYTDPRHGDYQAPVVHRLSSAPYRFRQGQLAQLARTHGLHP